MNLLSSSSRALCLTLVIGALCAQNPQGRRGGAGGPGGKPADLEHLTFQVKEFESASLKGTSRYGVFLPKGYDDEKNKSKRYPLVIWLHGLWEDHQRFHYRGESRALDAALGDGSLPEVVFVTPNGGTSFYLNGKESGAYEDLIVKDLVPEVEKNFRVEKDREHRVLMGNSMGGGGALRIAFKHPELFGIVATHSAALFPVDPEEIPERFRKILYAEGQQGFGLSKIFGVPPDLEMWRHENPLWLAEKVTPEQLDGMKLYFDCGGKDRYGFDKPNLALHDLLEKRKVKHTWRHVPNGGHGTEYAIANLPESLRFVGSALGVNAGKAGLEGLLGGGKDKTDAPGDGKGKAPESRKSGGGGK